MRKPVRCWVVVVLLAWVLWTGVGRNTDSYPRPGTWQMKEAFETKQECDVTKATRTHERGAIEAAQDPRVREFYFCWPAGSDPRP